MQPQQQQQTVITAVQPPQPVQVVQSQGQFNAKQASVVGVLLVIFGCLSILFNAVDLAIGTGMARYYTSWGGLSIHENTLSHASLGVAGHGFWCGFVVSYHVFRLHDKIGAISARCALVEPAFGPGFVWSIREVA